MLLFSAADRGRVANGEITVTFRLWKRPHVKAGKVYATGFGDVFVEDVRIMPAALIDSEDVRLAGLSDADAVRSKAGYHTKTHVGPETLLHRVQFRYLGNSEKPPPPARDPAFVQKRLARLDERSPEGPWTPQTLRLIADNPRVRAADLAAAIGMDRTVFKMNVRKLKALGLTESHDVGYTLTDAGHEVLDPGRHASGD